MQNELEAGSETCSRACRRSAQRWRTGRCGGARGAPAAGARHRGPVWTAARRGRGGLPAGSAAGALAPRGRCTSTRRAAPGTAPAARASAAPRLVVPPGARHRRRGRRPALAHEPQRPPDRGAAGGVRGAVAARALRRRGHRRLARRDGSGRHARVVAPAGGRCRRSRGRRAGCASPTSSPRGGDSQLRTIEGDGDHDRLLDRAVRPVVPSWRADSLAVAYVGAGGGRSSMTSPGARITSWGETARRMRRGSRSHRRGARSPWARPAGCGSAASDGCPPEPALSPASPGRAAMSSSHSRSRMDRRRFTSSPSGGPARPASLSRSPAASLRSTPVGAISCLPCGAAVSGRESLPRRHTIGRHPRCCWTSPPDLRSARSPFAERGAGPPGHRRTYSAYEALRVPARGGGGHVGAA